MPQNTPQIETPVNDAIDKALFALREAVKAANAHDDWVVAPKLSEVLVIVGDLRKKTRETGLLRLVESLGPDWK